VAKLFKIIFIILLMTYVLLFGSIENRGKNQSNPPTIKRLSPSLYRITMDYKLRTNTVVSVGNDGILLIDPGFKATTPVLKKVLRKLSQGALVYIFNTHNHGDHIQGNIIAETETRIVGLCEGLELLIKDGLISHKKFPHADKTKDKGFNKYFSLNFNGEEIRLIPAPGAHSQCDWIIHFTKSGVVHMGDLLLSQSFPAVGKNIKKYLPIMGMALNTFPDNAIFFSGHGKDLDKKGLKKYQQMLLTTIGIVKKGIKKGMTIKQMQSKRILKDFKSYNTFLDWLHTDYWIEAVYKTYKMSNGGVK